MHTKSYRKNKETKKKIEDIFGRFFCFLFNFKPIFDFNLLPNYSKKKDNLIYFFKSLLSFLVKISNYIY